jgi:hypothetical protein
MPWLMSRPCTLDGNFLRHQHVRLQQLREEAWAEDEEDRGVTSRRDARESGGALKSD